jgi:hypothetical protein
VSVFTGIWDIRSGTESDDPPPASPPYIRLRQHRNRVEGEYDLGEQQGHIDGRPDGEYRVIFSFEGIAGTELVNGAGTVVLEQDSLRLTLMYHYGEDRLYTAIRRQTAASGHG